MRLLSLRPEQREDHTVASFVKVISAITTSKNVLKGAKWRRDRSCGAQVVTEGAQSVNEGSTMDTMVVAKLV